MENWILCRDKKTKYFYAVKETRKDNYFELLFNVWPNYNKEDAWKHGGLKCVSRTLEGHLNSIYYNKFQSEKI